MSDDEEGDYNTIRHTKTGRGVKLLYTKSKVRFGNHPELCSFHWTAPSLFQRRSGMA